MSSLLRSRTWEKRLVTFSVPALSPLESRLLCYTRDLTGTPVSVLLLCCCLLLTAQCAQAWPAVSIATRQAAVTLRPLTSWERALWLRPLPTCLPPNPEVWLDTLSRSPLCANLTSQNSAPRACRQLQHAYVAYGGTWPRLGCRSLDRPESLLLRRPLHVLPVLPAARFQLATAVQDPWIPAGCVGIELCPASCNDRMSPYMVMGM